MAHMTWNGDSYKEASSPQYSWAMKVLQTASTHQYFSPTSKTMMVLDLGCGDGRITNFIQHSLFPTAKVIGVDLSENQIQVAKRLYSSIDFHVLDIRSINDCLFIVDDTIDIITSFSCLHWIMDHHQVCRNLSAKLKIGGSLHFTLVAKMTSPFAEACTKLLISPLSTVPVDVAVWRTFLTQVELSNIWWLLPNATLHRNMAKTFPPLKITVNYLQLPFEPYGIPSITNEALLDSYKSLLQANNLTPLSVSLETIDDSFVSVEELILYISQWLPFLQYIPLEKRQDFMKFFIHQLLLPSIEAYQSTSQSPSTTKIVLSFTHLVVHAKKM